MVARVGPCACGPGEFVQVAGERADVVAQLLLIELVNSAEQAVAQPLKSRRCRQVSRHLSRDARFVVGMGLVWPQRGKSERVAALVDQTAGDDQPHRAIAGRFGPVPVPRDKLGGLLAGLLVKVGNEVLAAEGQGVRDERVLFIGGLVHLADRRPRTPASVPAPRPTPARSTSFVP